MKTIPNPFYIRINLRLSNIKLTLVYFVIWVYVFYNHTDE